MSRTSVEDVRESLQMIRRNVELEARLIDDLLDLTRIDRGKVQLNFEVVDAHTLLENALEICQPEIDRKHLRPSLNLSAKRVHMRADSGAIAADLLEPDQQRGEIYAAKRANHDYDEQRFRRKIARRDCRYRHGN